MAGYAKRRADWLSYPDTTTPIRQSDLDAWETALYELKYLAYNVKDYGATGNGSTDDYAAINTALTDAAAGGIVYFPAGVYAISDNLQPASNVMILGAGIATTTIRLRAGSFGNFGFSYLIEPSGSSSGVAVANLTLDGNLRAGGASANQGGLLGAGDHWLIDRVRFYDANYFKLFIDSRTGVRVRNCRWDATGGSNDNIGGGTTNENVVIENCFFASDITGNAIDFTGGTGYVIRNCRSEANNWYLEGITDSLIEGNYIFDGDLVLQDTSGYSPATLDTCRGVSVIGNTIVNAAGIGISIRYEDYASASTRNTGGGNQIIGNTVRAAQTAGILIHGRTSPLLKTRGDVIANNVIENPNAGSANTINTGVDNFYCAGIVDGVGIGDIIVGNTIVDNLGTAKMQYGIALTGQLGAGVVDKAQVYGNTSVGHTTSGLIIHNATYLTASTIRNNRGYNPVGAAATTPAASAWTYTAGYTPEVLHLRAGTVSLVVKNGVTLYVATPCSVPLEPGEQVTVTYSSVPTAIVDQK